MGAALEKQWDLIYLYSVHLQPYRSDMSQTMISSRSNPKIKLARGLYRRKTRQDSSLFIAEGIHITAEALKSGSLIHSIFYSPDLLRSTFALGLIETAATQEIACYATTPEVFQSISGKENPVGILALVRQSSFSLQALNPENFSFAVALITPQDPGNIGSILRTIDAAGANGLILLDRGADPYHPSAVRASMGAIFWHPIIQADLSEFKGWVADQGYRIYGTSAHAYTDYQQIERYIQPLVLVMGSERGGLSQEQTSMCDVLIRLPMKGRCTSLNLAVATGILLYDILQKIDQV